MYESKDNEFIAWYPPAVTREQAASVWSPRRAGYYVHIPFCSAICHYCGFSVERLKGAAVDRYLEALRLEIERYAEAGRLAGHRFDCGHFGGGTPSAIDAEALMDVKRTIDASFDVAANAEVTVEVNPISFDAEKARVYHEGGVNRISVGVQSFDDETLRTIGRPHRRGDVLEAVRTIRETGWDNYSLDIIYGIPGQTRAKLRDDLLRAADTGAAHLSCFRLEIIPFTVLKLRESAGLMPPRLDVEELNAMDDLVSSVLTENGYREYGAFNFARPGYESVHNAIAFVAPQGEYAGFGNSAWSWANGHVYTNEAAVPRYEEAVFEGRDPIASARRATTLEEMSRYFVLGLKFFRVPRAPFVERFGIEPEAQFGDVLDRLTGAGMLVAEDDAYLLTRRGRHYVNNVCKEFYVGENRGARQWAEFIPTLTAEQVAHYAKLATTAR